jgi:hypothetical protein
MHVSTRLKLIFQIILYRNNMTICGNVEIHRYRLYMGMAFFLHNPSTCRSVNFTTPLVSPLATSDERL